ncbi:MAG: D-glycero-beta-D-manno-heptose 1-phosphate adenylyltransferase [Planctomycetota bacterium]|nr:MAG: D-glycero-beta-D-manno-heptose 1-phosphate adenylyltransferase [Planctomycetota bacterium]
MIKYFSQLKTKFSKAKILVIGDIILDAYIEGHSNRISPEAPIPIIEANSYRYVPGGAGNVVNNLNALGAKSTLIGLIGKDQEAEILKNIFKKENVSLRGLIKSNRPTTLKTRVIGDNQQLVRIDREETQPANKKEESQILIQIAKLIKKKLCDGIIVSDYAKGVINKNIMKTIIKLAKKEKIAVFVDPKNKDFSIYNGADIIKPNLKEAISASKLSNLDGSDNSTIEKMGKQLLKMSKAKGILISRNKYGLSLIQKNETFHYKTQALEVSDVSGAGDTLTSIFALCASINLPYSICSELSNIGAGLVVQKQGTATISVEELLKQLHKTHAHISKTSSSERNALKQLIDMEKSLGNKIVFTNGCFDLLHVGHVKLLEESKKCGDILIVAINSDKSVKKLKGPQRPLIQENDRARILLGLEAVDYVVIFDEGTPKNLLRLLQPDILVKGGDYSHDQVVGYEIVEKYGGKIKLINLVDGKSTTNTLNKILKNP